MRYALLAVVVGVGACERRERAVEAPQAAPKGAPSAATRWTESRSAADTALLEAPARVLASPDGQASIAPPLQARIVRVRVQPGQTIAAGAPVVDVLMPELLHAAGDLVGEQLKVDAFSRRKAQLEALRAEGLARLAELAEVEAQLATARADAQAARATLRAAGVSDKQAEALVAGDGVIALRAPIAGLLVAVDAVAGEVRDPAGRPLATIVGGGEGRVEARLPASPHRDARFTFIAPSGGVPLELLSVSSRVEPTDGARLAWFTAKPGSPPLPIGAAGRVRVLADEAWRVVPARALLERGGRVSLRQRTPAGSAEVSVEVIARSGAEAVVSGLEPGAVVAADRTDEP